MCMDNEKTKKEAYRPLRLYFLMCAMVVYYMVASYHGLMTHSFADEIIALISIALIIGVPIYTVVVTIRYILIISKKDVPTWKKVLWGIVLFEFNVWVFPMFWRRHIRIEPSEIEQEENLSATATYEKTEYTPNRLEYDKEYNIRKFVKWCIYLIRV